MWAKTKRGYIVEVDPEVRVGDIVTVHPWEPGELTSDIPDERIRFIGQAYGQKKRVASILRQRYEISEDFTSLPEYIFNLPDEKLYSFLVHLYAAGGALFRHDPSNPKAPRSVEVRITTKHESLAREIQYLLARFGIRTRVWFAKAFQVWQVNSSGFDAYVKIRDIILATKNPKLKTRVTALDKFVPFTYARDIEKSFKDGIAELSEEPFECYTFPYTPMQATLFKAVGRGGDDDG